MTQEKVAVVPVSKVGLDRATFPCVGVANAGHVIPGEKDGNMLLSFLVLIFLRDM